MSGQVWGRNPQPPSNRPRLFRPSRPRPGRAGERWSGDKPGLIGCCQSELQRCAPNVKADISTSDRTHRPDKRRLQESRSTRDCCVSLADCLSPPQTSCPPPPARFSRLSPTTPRKFVFSFLTQYSSSDGLIVILSQLFKHAR
ncbi:hypothetical protein RRG08_049178 [Elysia crispata]|uniref:Uncharacterized protein n=1 Tax=Elysia crispata TaxID=231223 RepID=A0AAE1E2X7_9GAST|nr:hypothetical protein RRG08_049178 [Elysia crispata]